MSYESLRKELIKIIADSPLSEREICKRAGWSTEGLDRLKHDKGRLGVSGKKLDALLAVFDLELHHRKLRKKKG